MSTKIYAAWRCKHHHFEAFLKAFRHHCFIEARKMVRKLAAAVKDEVLIKGHKDFNKYRKRTGKDPKLSFDEFVKIHGPRVRVHHVSYLAGQASASPYRCHLCLDTSLNIWRYKKYTYIIPYGEFWMLQRFKPPAGVEEYAYYNNTDQPPEITRRQWTRRGKTWDQVCLNNWDETRLTHIVIEGKTGLGMYELTKGLVKEDHRFSASIGWQDAILEMKANDSAKQNRTRSRHSRRVNRSSRNRTNR